MTASARASAAQTESEVPATPPFRGVRLRRRLVTAVLSGVLLTFCFPKYNLATLAWVALIPLMAAIEGAPPHRAFWLGGLAGTVGYIGILSWVTITMTRYGNLPFPVAWIVMLMLAVYLSLFTGVFCALVCRFGRQSRLVQLALAPFLWVGLELARTHLLTGFPWAALGYTQYAALPVIQVADITGIYGVSFLIVLVNSALWGVMRDFIPAYARPHGKPGGEGRAFRGSAWALGATAVLLGAALLYGRARLETFATPSPGGARPDRSVRIALLQGNIPQEVKWDEAYRLKTLEAYENLTYQHAQGKPDLIVWPETAAPFFFLRDKAHRERVLNLSEKVRAPLLVGAVSVALRNREYRLRNSAFLVTPEKKVVGQYHKTHLVPYGEYVPLKRFFPFIRKMVSGIGDFLPGDRRTVFPLAKAPFSVLICYEVIFANEVRKFVRNGARLLVNITNDAWFGRSAGPYQHMSIAVLRAVENRVPLVRAANTGITGVVDATGKIRAATALFVRTGVLASVAPGMPGPAGLTFYTRHGDLFAYLSAALAVLILGLHWATGRHSARKG